MIISIKIDSLTKIKKNTTTYYVNNWKNEMYPKFLYEACEIH